MSVCVLPAPLPRSERRLRMFCFPYAGGGIHTFRTWSAYLPPSVEVCAVQMPGRGARIKETCHTSMRELVRDLCNSLGPGLDLPFVFFGHSMGALVCFEVARLLRATGRVMPLHVFVAGRRAPQIPLRDYRSYELSEQDLLRELWLLNGTPRELLANRKLMQLMLPALRADFKVHGTYIYTAERALDCPITAFGGMSDEAVTLDHLKGWRWQTTSTFAHHLLPGDHFFLNQYRALLLEEINKENPQCPSRFNQSLVTDFLEVLTQMRQSRAYFQTVSKQGLVVILAFADWSNPDVPGGFG